MKAIFMYSLLLSLCLGPWQRAYADAAFVCVEEQSLDGANAGLHDGIELASLQCNSLKVTDTSLEAISLTFAASSLYMACTGIGVTVSLVLQGAVVGLQAAKLLVGNLPCDDQTEDVKIKAAARQAVCDALAEDGVGCRL